MLLKLILKRLQICNFEFAANHPLVNLHPRQHTGLFIAPLIAGLEAAAFSTTRSTHAGHLTSAPLIGHLHLLKLLEEVAKLGLSCKRGCTQQRDEQERQRLDVFHDCFSMNGRQLSY